MRNNLKNETEKQFFEAYGIKPEYRYRYNAFTNVCADNTKEDVLHEREYWLSKNIHKPFVDEVIAQYPKLTAEKLSELEDILHKEYNILIYERYSGFIALTACPAPDEDWGADEAYFRVIKQGKNKQEALLNVLSDFNVVNAIKDEVVKLFDK